MNELFGRSGRRPTVACDASIFTYINGVLHFLAVKRGNEPFKGQFALPGGFMEWDESCEQCVARELAEETGLTGLKLEQVGVYSKPGRDPRGTIVSVSYMALIESSNIELRAGDDAAEAEWIMVENHPTLAFDHDIILKNALLRLESKD